jgi:UDP-N-acetylmuramoyl-tripeptide--D-alanyl-D-alanine ligase
MKAAINVLTSLQGEGKKIAVLGDMFELGTHSRILHEEVGQYILSTTLKEVYTVGEMSAYITEVLSANPNMESRHFKTQDECLNYLGHRISKGDIVLFKASRGMHFEKMVEKLGKENSYEK